MTSKSELLQKAWHRYEMEHDHLPTTAREVVEWAVAEGIVVLPNIDPYDVLANDMSRALREEYDIDDEGNRYRRNHAVRVTKDGVQNTFWGIMGFAPHAHMEKAFSQRRNQIIGDCLQLKVDVDVYNKISKEEPLQLVLDFTDDVAERQFTREAA